MIRLRLLYALVFLYSGDAIAGGMGGSGGSPPALQVEQFQFTEILDGAMNGDFIRLSLPDSEPRILKPEPSKLEASQIEAVDIVDGSTVILQPSLSTAEKKLSTKQFGESTRIARVQQPSVSESVASTVTPNVEVVPAEEIRSDPSIHTNQPSVINADQGNENGEQSIPSP